MLERLDELESLLLSARGMEQNGLLTGANCQEMSAAKNRDEESKTTRIDPMLQLVREKGRKLVGMLASSTKKCRFLSWVMPFIIYTARGIKVSAEAQ